jgi:hypothetical protein
LAGLGLYFLQEDEPEKVIYNDTEVALDFVKVANRNGLSYERFGFEKVNNETMEMKIVRFFTEDFRDQDFQSAGSCSDERTKNGGYELYVRTNVDKTINSEYTLDNIDWESKISRAEESVGTEEVKMISVQELPFIYHRGSAVPCGKYVIVEGWTSPSHKVHFAMNYYDDVSLEDFDEIVNSLQFLDI